MSRRRIDDRNTPSAGQAAKNKGSTNRHLECLALIGHPQRHANRGCRCWGYVPCTDTKEPRNAAQRRGLTGAVDLVRSVAAVVLHVARQRAPYAAAVAAAKLLGCAGGKGWHRQGCTLLQPLLYAQSKVVHKCISYSANPRWRVPNGSSGRTSYAITRELGRVWRFVIGNGGSLAGLAAGKMLLRSSHWCCLSRCQHVYRVFPKTWAKSLLQKLCKYLNIEIRIE